MDINQLPLELSLQVAEHLSLSEHAACLRTCRRFEQAFGRALYVRLRPLHEPGAAVNLGELGSHQDDSTELKEQRTFGRKDVVRWAVERGSVATLLNIDAIEPLQPLINTTGFLKAVPGLETEEDPLVCLSILQLACIGGHIGMAKFLLHRGAKVDVSLDRNYGLLPIHFATTAELVQALISSGSSLSISGGVSPLSISLYCGADAGAVRSFLDLGSDPEEAAPDGTTAAVLAIKNGDIDALQALIDVGANVTKPLPRGEHPLYHAIWLAHRAADHDVALRLVRKLLDNGADANSGYSSSVVSNSRSGQSEEHFTPYLFLATMMTGTANIVSLLLRRGADVNCHFTKRQSLLDPEADSIPYFRVTADMTKTLVGNLIMAIINAAKDDSDDPIVKPDSLRKLHALVAHGADMKDFWSFNNYDGRITEQPFAFLEMIPHLMKLGADVDHLGGKPGNGHDDRLIHFLIDKLYPKVSDVWTASQMYCDIRLKTTSFLALPMDVTIQHGADPNVAGRGRMTPLMLLCAQKPSMAAALLMDRLLGRHKIDIAAKDNDGMMALHYAARIKFPTGEADHDFCFRLQLLLKHSQNIEDVNAVDEIGRTPLHGLLDEGSCHMPESQIDSTSKSSLHCEYRALTMLIRFGANTTTRAVPPPSLLVPLGWLRGEFQYCSMRTFFGPDGDDVWEVGSNIKDDWHDDGEYEGLGDTPLHMACQRSLDPTMHIELLLRHGARKDVNAVSRRLHLTPLMTLVGLAAKGNIRREAMTRAIKLLLDAGADPQMRDTKNRTAWEVSMEMNDNLPSWLWGLYLEDIMPEMPEEWKRKALGLGA